MRKLEGESITRRNFLFRRTRPVKFKGGVGAVVYNTVTVKGQHHQ
jgi:hypothetical protein